MSIDKKELYKILDEICPFEIQENWDNSGLQVDNENNVIKKILVALEITPEVIEEAKEVGADCIVTHHPLIFRALRCIDRNRYEDNLVFQCIKNNLMVYSCHTNFDKAVKGNNFYLAKLLELKEIQYLEKPGEIGVTGILKEKLTINEFTETIKKSLNISKEEISLAGYDGGKYIEKVGICTGAGGDQLEIMKRERCDAFITGDFKYHDAVKSKALEILVVDAGHYGTEKIFVPNMSNQLKDLIGEKAVIYQSQIDINPFIYRDSMVKL